MGWLFCLVGWCSLESCLPFNPFEDGRELYERFQYIFMKGGVAATFVWNLLGKRDGAKLAEKFTKYPFAVLRKKNMKNTRGFGKNGVLQEL